jgi:hypothetical protein
MKTTTAFLYRWTELSTGKWYIGSRTAKYCHPDDGYICSSKIVAPLISANRNDWRREILATGEPKYIALFETQFLTLLDAKRDSMSYNQVNHWPNIGMIGRSHPLKGIKTGPRGPQKNPHTGLSSRTGKPSPCKGIKSGKQKNPRSATWINPRKGKLKPIGWVDPKKGRPSPFRGIKTGPRGPQKNPHKGPSPPKGKEQHPHLDTIVKI